MQLKFTTILFFLSFITVSQIGIAQSAKEELKFVNLFSSDMKEGVSCYRIPSIITALNGDVIAAIDERVPSCGDLRSNNDINIVMRRSADSGKSWSKIQTIVDYPLGESASDPSMIVDESSGEIFMFFNYMNLETEKDVYYLKMVSSKDNGLTWSTPTDITAQITKPEWKKDFKFITSGRGLQTKSGELLHTIVNLEKGLFVFKSDDHGKNWSLIDTPILPADESKIMELEDGSWMINSRVSKVGVRYIHTSTDHGKTWTSNPDSQLIDPACNASFIRYSLKDKKYSKNRLLFSNVNSPNKRENLTVKISYDEGKTWSKGKTIYVGESAYSSMTVLKNGDIGLFFEKDGYKKNAFVSFSLDWLTDGTDAVKSSKKKQGK
ncbi:sialidase family protein [Flavobacterium sp. TMP13]|uniref:sialidase family protein n=1 Tax=unclassified Flavobacterium TaxID=196869 RepID=UPI00076C4F00|nr:sialidase family protein [Flavobacterium sp. TAB 87]KVV14848.1 Sialidase precursor [Flavobacterium sp. TAB 87]